MKIIHDDFLLLENEAVFAMTDGSNIYVDDYFYNLSHDVKKFILSHEEGHIVLNHEVNKFNDLFQEKAADKYAFEHTSVKAAREFIAVLEKINKGKDSIINSRIIGLKSLIAIDNIVNSNNEERISTLLEILDDAADLFANLKEV